MCLIYHLIRFCQVVAVETFYHSSCSVRKHRSFVVIAISVQRIYLKTIPHFCVYIVLSFQKKGWKSTRMTMGSPGYIPSSDTNGKFDRFSSACFFQAAHRLSDSMNRGFSFPCHTSGPMKKNSVAKLFPAMYSPVSTRRCISLPLYYILPSWTRRYNRGLINLLPYNILKLFFSMRVQKYTLFFEK